MSERESINDFDLMATYTYMSKAVAAIGSSVALLDAMLDRDADRRAIANAKAVAKKKAGKAAAVTTVAIIPPWRQTDPRAELPSSCVALVPVKKPSKPSGTASGDRITGCKGIPNCSHERSRSQFLCRSMLKGANPGNLAIKYGRDFPCKTEAKACAQAEAWVKAKKALS